MNRNTAVQSIANQTKPPKAKPEASASPSASGLEEGLSWTNLQGFPPTGPKMPLKIFFPTPADLNWSVINPIESVTNQVELVTNQVVFVANQVVFVANQVGFAANQVVFVANQVGLVTNQIGLVTNQIGLVTDLIRSAADLGGKKGLESLKPGGLA